MILSNGLSITLASLIPSVEYEIRKLVIENVSVIYSNQICIG